MSVHWSLGAVGAIAAIGMSAVASNATAEVAKSLSWTSISDCPSKAFCDPAGSDIVDVEYVASLGNSTSFSIFRDGATSFASVGEGAVLGLPELKAGVYSPINGTSEAFAIAIGVQGLHWTGSGDITLPLQAMFTYSLGGTGEVEALNAGIAITNSSVLDPTIADLWMGSDLHGRFSADCSTTGALGIAQTVTDINAGSATTLDVGACSPGSLTLSPGEQVFVWTRVFAYSRRGGLVDATHTLSVDISPDASLAHRQALLAGIRNTGFAAVPEPSTWALLILGFGVTGALVRRERRMPAVGRTGPCHVGR